jgi:hypothetical protein
MRGTLLVPLNPAVSRNLHTFTSIMRYNSRRFRRTQPDRPLCWRVKGTTIADGAEQARRGRDVQFAVRGLKRGRVKPPSGAGVATAYAAAARTTRDSSCSTVDAGRRTWGVGAAAKLTLRIGIPSYRVTGWIGRQPRPRRRARGYPAALPDHSEMLSAGAVTEARRAAVPAAFPCAPGASPVVWPWSSSRPSGRSCRWRRSSPGRRLGRFGAPLVPPRAHRTAAAYPRRAATTSGARRDGCLECGTIPVR